MRWKKCLLQNQPSSTEHPLQLSSIDMRIWRIVPTPWALLFYFGETCGLLASQYLDVVVSSGSKQQQRSSSIFQEKGNDTYAMEKIMVERTIFSDLEEYLISFLLSCPTHPPSYWWFSSILTNCSLRRKQRRRGPSLLFGGHTGTNWKSPNWFVDYSDARVYTPGAVVGQTHHRHLHLFHQQFRGSIPLCPADVDDLLVCYGAMLIHLYWRYKGPWWINCLFLIRC